MLTENQNLSIQEALKSDSQRRAFFAQKKKGGGGKSQFSFRHNDGSNSGGSITRNRVAYLLKAAKSRRDKIEVKPTGYKIGSLSVLRKGNVPEVVSKSGRLFVRADKTGNISSSDLDSLSTKGSSLRNTVASSIKAAKKNRSKLDLTLKAGHSDSRKGFSAFSKAYNKTPSRSHAAFYIN